MSVRVLRFPPRPRRRVRTVFRPRRRVVVRPSGRSRVHTACIIATAATTHSPCMYPGPYLIHFNRGNKYLDRFKRMKSMWSLGFIRKNYWGSLRVDYETGWLHGLHSLRRRHQTSPVLHTPHHHVTFCRCFEGGLVRGVKQGRVRIDYVE